MNLRYLSTILLSFAAGCFAMWLYQRKANAPSSPAAVLPQPGAGAAVTATIAPPSPTAPEADDTDPSPGGRADFNPYADIPPAPAEGRLRIGAWNIENLGTSKTQQKPEDLAAYILESGVHVLSLEEIHDDDQPDDDTPGHAPWRNAVLDQTFAILTKSTGAPWEYTLTAPSEANRRQQMTGVAWNTAKVSLKGRYVVPVEGGQYNNEPGLTYWTRQPEAFQFSTGEALTDFVLVPLHMKSNSGGNGEPMRQVEARQLMDKISGVTSQFAGEADIVLLGDSNMLPEETGVSETWAPAFKDLNSAGHYTYIKPYRNQPFPPFDRIFVPAAQPEFADCWQITHGPWGSGKEVRRAWRDNHLATRSDHLMVFTDIAVQKDDD